ncbi:hypothetical protein NDU88_003528 [Pleurodeles waltl]|uniref:Uncharacterized protein n=1 Tax=Pleurodeles waltl TaxID=8319 RepID=A0AAV7UYR4_PLEWA|nr:hypothetical protein NDU88_003528 [Pleurodeles waltl]
MGSLGTGQWFKAVGSETPGTPLCGDLPLLGKGGSAVGFTPPVSSLEWDPVVLALDKDRTGSPGLGLGEGMMPSPARLSRAPQGSTRNTVCLTNKKSRVKEGGGIKAQITPGGPEG